MPLEDELALVETLNSIVNTKLRNYDSVYFNLNTDNFSSNIVFINSNIVWDSEESDSSISMVEQVKINLENIISDLTKIKEEL